MTFYTNDKHALDYYCTDEEKDNASCFMGATENSTDVLVLCLLKCFLYQ